MRAKIKLQATSEEQVQSLVIDPSTIKLFHDMNKSYQPFIMKKIF